MKWFGNPYEELYVLLAGHLDGRLDEDEQATLACWLRDDPVAQDIYLDFIAIHVDFCTKGAPSTFSEREWRESDWAETLEEPCLDSQPIDEYPIADTPPQFPASFSSNGGRVPGSRRPRADARPSARRRRQIAEQSSRAKMLTWTAGVVVFACLLIGLSRWDLRPVPPQVPPRDTRPLAAAWVNTLHNVEWADGQAPYAWGAPVASSSTLKINSGLLRLVFASGAEVLLEGPASFTVQTVEAGRLSLGKLVARAETDQAQGFTIRTPTAQIIDLGTEFGVTVDQHGRTKTHVFAGRVIAQAIGGKRAKSEALRLEAGQAATVEKQGVRISRVAASSESFVRHTPPRPLKPVIHFAMEEPAGPLVDQRGKHKAKENGGRGFLYRQPGVPPGTYGAIRLGPDGTGFAVGLSDATSQWHLDAAGTARLNLVNNFTAMAWLYLPAAPTGIVKVMGQGVTKPIGGWDFGVRESGTGRGIFFAGGSLEASYSGTAIPWTGGQWHHIAVTKSSTEGIRFYLDGNPVGADTRPVARSNLYRLADREFFCLGRGNDYAADGQNGRRIDEFRVYGTCLTREEIVLAAGGVIEEDGDKRRE